jgi:hypothetical protein
VAVLSLGALSLWAAPAFAGAIVSSPGCTQNTLAANDDGSTGEITLPFSINFFGTTYSSLWVNNNGNVTFTGPLGDFTPDPIVTNGMPMIAPFWADVDTRGDGSGLVSYGTTTFGGAPAFCVLWPNVGYFAGHTDKLNSFQLLLIDRSSGNSPGDFDIMMNYDQVQWETGDASGGSGGLGGTSARVGFTNGSSTAYELPGSGVSGSFLDSNPSMGLVNNDHGSTQLGRYVYPVRNGVVSTPPGPPTNLNAAAGSTDITVTWNPPADEGSVAVDHYTITYTPAGGTPPPPINVPAQANETPTTLYTKVISGLTPDTEYTIDVTAHSKAGTSTAAETTATPTGEGAAPDAPTNVSGIPGDASAVVRWTASVVTEGGAPVLQYDVTCSGEGGQTGTAQTPDGATTQIIVSGLTNGVAYVCDVVAVSDDGTSPPGVSNTFVPTVNNATIIVPPGQTATVATDGGAAPTPSDPTTSALLFPKGPGGFARVYDTGQKGLSYCAKPGSCIGQVTTFHLPPGYGVHGVAPVKVVLVYDKSALSTDTSTTTKRHFRVNKIITNNGRPTGEVESNRLVPLCVDGKYQGMTCQISATIAGRDGIVDHVHVHKGDLVIKVWAKSGDPTFKGHG